MDIQTAFLSDIAENREDDAPRLIFADWLDDHGDPERAQFIRAQCRLATMSPGDPDRFGLEIDVEDLYEKHSKKWLAAVPKLRASIGFDRGFPAWFQLPVPKLLEHGKALFAAVPTLCEFHPQKYASDWSEFVNSPWLERLSGLHMGETSITAGRVAELLRSPRIAGLRTLSIGGARLGRMGASALIDCPHLTNLRHLSIHNGACAALIERLVESSNYPSLETFHLLDTGMNAPAAAALARSPLASQLTSLVVHDPNGGDDVVRALAAGDWRSLRVCSLGLRQITATGMAALAECDSFANLQQLHLMCPGNQTFAGSVLSPYLTHLERLELFEVSSESLEALASSPVLANLRRLTVRQGSTQNAKGVTALLTSQALAGLVEFAYSGGPVEAMAECFAAATHLTSLRRLAVVGSQVGEDDWLLKVIQAPHLASVVWLDLRYAKASQKALQALLDSRHLTSLRRLWLSPDVNHSKRHMKKPLEKRFGQVLRIG